MAFPAEKRTQSKNRYFRCGEIYSGFDEYNKLLWGRFLSRVRKGSIYIGFCGYDKNLSECGDRYEVKL